MFSRREILVAMITKKCVAAAANCSLNAVQLTAAKCQEDLTPRGPHAWLREVLTAQSV